MLKQITKHSSLAAFALVCFGWIALITPDSVDIFIVFLSLLLLIALTIKSFEAPRVPSRSFYDFDIQERVIAILGWGSLVGILIYHFAVNRNLDLWPTCAPIIAANRLITLPVINMASSSSDGN